MFEILPQYADSGIRMVDGRNMVDINHVLSPSTIKHGGFGLFGKHEKMVDERPV